MVLVGGILTCCGGCYPWIGTVCNSLLLSRKAGAGALWALRSSGGNRELSRLLLCHLHTLVADLLGAESLVGQLHGLRRCVVLIKMVA